MGPERTCKRAEIKALKVDGECSEDAPPFIRKILKRGVEADPIHGLFETAIGGEPAVVESEPDSGLRDTEHIPLATLNGADILASWNFKHMVNWRRIRSYNEVNIERGMIQSIFELRRTSPLTANGPEKSFDCVAFMREARSRLSQKMNSMSGEEFRHWLRHGEYSVPQLAKLAAQARPAEKRPE